MSPDVKKGLIQLSDQFLSFYNSFDHDTRVQSDPVSDSLAETLGLNLNPPQVSWKPRPLKHDAFNIVVSNLGEQFPTPTEPSSVKACSEIYDAYPGSKMTYAAIRECVNDGMFHSEDFFNTETDQYDFLRLEAHLVYPHILVESRLLFCTPLNPHVTVVSILPQQGPPDNLMLTELFTLIYWAQYYARRGKKFTSLPIRLVSIWDTKARFLMADFSHGYLRCLATKEGDTRGLPVNMDVTVGAYYDLCETESFLQFMKKLVDLPVSPSAF